MQCTLYTVNIVGNSTEQNPACGHNSQSHDQNILHLLWNPKTPCCVYVGARHCPQSDDSCPHSRPVLNFLFNITFQFAFWPFSWCIYLWLLIRIFVCIHHFPYVAARFWFLSIITSLVVHIKHTRHKFQGTGQFQSRP
jgi:hypothetical protein